MELDLIHSLTPKRNICCNRIAENTTCNLWIDRTYSVWLKFIFTIPLGWAHFFVTVLSSFFSSISSRRCRFDHSKSHFMCERIASVCDYLVVLLFPTFYLWCVIICYLRLMPLPHYARQFSFQVHTHSIHIFPVCHTPSYNGQCNGERYGCE